MEEEYRHEKTAAEKVEKEKTASTTTIRGSPDIRPSNGDGSIHSDDDVVSQKDGQEKEGDAEGKDDEEDGYTSLEKAPSDGSPTADASTEKLPVIEKPEQAVDAGEKDESAEDPEAPGESSAKKYTHFQNKRLCERWLDNLFMLLYEVN